MSSEQCSWCETPVHTDDGFRVSAPALNSRAVFCRLEHIVPWAIQGAGWMEGEAGASPPPEEAPPPPEESPFRCAYCEGPLDEAQVLLVRHRGPHRIRDDFCSVEHLLDWAKAGGRWQ